MVFEVFPCLLLRNWQEDFAGPQQAVTLKQPVALNQPKASKGWGDVLLSIS